MDRASADRVSRRLVASAVAIGWATPGENRPVETLLPADSVLYVSWVGTEHQQEAWENTAAFEALEKSGLVAGLTKLRPLVSRVDPGTQTRRQSRTCWRASPETGSRSRSQSLRKPPTRWSCSCCGMPPDWSRSSEEGCLPSLGNWKNSRRSTCGVGISRACACDGTTILRSPGGLRGAIWSPSSAERPSRQSWISPRASRRQSRRTRLAQRLPGPLGFRPGLLRMARRRTLEGPPGKRARNRRIIDHPALRGPRPIAHEPRSRPVGLDRVPLWI